MEMREEIKSDLLAIQRIAGTAEQKACIRTKLLQFLDIDPLHSPQISSQRLLVLLEERLLQLKQVPRCDPMLVENALNEELLLQQHDPASQQLADAIRHVLRLVAPYSTCITSPQATLIENEQAQLMRLLGGTLRPLLLDHTQSTEPIPMLTAGIQSQLMRIKWLSPHRLCAYSYTMFTKLLGQFISDRCLVNYRLLRVINCWYQALIRHFKWELHQLLPCRLRPAAEQWRQRDNQLSIIDCHSLNDDVLVVCADLFGLFDRLKWCASDAEIDRWMSAHKWHAIFQLHVQLLRDNNVQKTGADEQPAFRQLVQQDIQCYNLRK